MAAGSGRFVSRIGERGLAGKHTLFLSRVRSIG
jgi:hypothetical protein